MGDSKHIEQELLDILEAAILDEMASAARYRRGAELSTETELKTLFEQLVKDELAHEAALKERYYAIKKRLGFKVMKDGDDQ
jgi:rubrerythrin